LLLPLPLPALLLFAGDAAAACLLPALAGREPRLLCTCLLCTAGHTRLAAVLAKNGSMANHLLLWMKLPGNPACGATLAGPAALVAGLLLLGSTSCGAGAVEAELSLHVFAEVHAPRAVELQGARSMLLQR
jgi:hypothetical protein